MISFPAAATELHRDVDVERAAVFVHCGLLAVLDFRDERTQAISAEADGQAVGAHGRLLDQQLDDPLSLGWEQLIPHRAGGR